MCSDYPQALWEDLCCCQQLLSQSLLFMMFSQATLDYQSVHTPILNRRLNRNKRNKLNYWKTYSGAWVDLVVPVFDIEFLTSMVWQSQLLMVLEMATMGLAVMVLVIMILTLPWLQF